MTVLWYEGDTRHSLTSLRPERKPRCVPFDGPGGLRQSCDGSEGAARYLSLGDHLEGGCLET
jgi:hypothetical protein